MLFIHGVGSSKHAWDALAELMPAERPLVTYDLRGHGESNKPMGPYNIDAFINDALSLMDDLGYSEFELIGFSLGGLIAQGIALRAPKRVRHLVVIGTVANRTPEEKSRARQRYHEIVTEGPAVVAERSVDRWYTPSYLAEHPEVRAQTIERMAALDPAAYAASYRVLATTDFAGYLGTIMVPVLAIAGSEDVGSPPHMAQYIIDSVKNGRVVVFEGVKHNMLNIIPKRIAKEVIDHVTG